MDEQALNELHAEAIAESANIPASEAGTAGPASDVAPAVMDPVQEWASLLKIAVMVLTPAMPFLPAIYTDEALAAVGSAIVPVADKYGVTAGGLFGKFGPEIGLAVVAGPLVIRTAMEFKAMRAAQLQAVEAAAAAGTATVDPAPATAPDAPSA